MGAFLDALASHSDLSKSLREKQLFDAQMRQAEEERGRRGRKLSEALPGSPQAKTYGESTVGDAEKLAPFINATSTTPKAPITWVNRDRKDRSSYDTWSPGRVPYDASMDKVETGRSGIPSDIRTANDLRKEFINRPEIKEYVTVNTQVKAMDALLQGALSGKVDNRVALDQGLISIYNKITDPQSVVRESEYARTPENLPIVNRIAGAIQKIGQGGAGLTDDDRKALVLGAKLIANERGKQFMTSQGEYNTLAGKYAIDPSIVTGTLPPFKEYSMDQQPPAQAQPTAVPSVGQYFSGEKVKAVRRIR